MKKQKFILSILLYIFLSACTTFFNGDSSGKQIDTYEPVENNKIIELICAEKTDCIKTICPDLNECPLTIALSHPVVYDFISEYSKCVDCNTPVFSPKIGIGKCVEYEVLNSEVRFWISDNCNFRYGNPSQTRISVRTNSTQSRIQQIIPSVETILDPTYCVIDSDCRCLSGSGLPFVGCSNSFYAPLNPTGFFEGEECGCVEGRCVARDG
ncbi:MAG: hypothetical protein Q7U53_08080 [Anaerolineaceae bacterium]|nr:hypothetical protein [Anaerolineaceae bacterium]